MSEPLSPWHEGKIRLQEATGMVDRMQEVGRRVLRDHLIDQHRQFYPQLPFILLGSVDADGDVWAAMRDGRPGFLQALDEHTLAVLTPRQNDDPAEDGLDDGAAVGMLGIELHTRRRNRLNGVVRRTRSEGFEVAVGQSFGNCPKYIRLRDFDFIREAGVRTAAAPILLDRLDALAKRMIAGADTFFVATYADRKDAGRQVDVSHRGGKPGFVRVGADGALTIPDFMGNFFFNTLGNILLNGQAGLVFADFETGDLLQMSGTAEVVLGSPELAAFEGAERFWRFMPRKIVHRPDALALRWQARKDGQSPQSLMTGGWQQAG